VIQKSKVIDDLVITSANVGTVALSESKLSIEVSLRATQSFVIENTMAQVEFLADTLGFNVEFSAKYPGWNYDVNSKFRKHLLEVFKEMRGADMDVVATHGGLELGIWKDKLPELDIVSFGPIMFDIHTPQERLDLASFDRTYEFMVRVLKDLKK
ncbi:MAG: aminoacyl-histidine dipeptidase, partial [Erysipelothrix sp.]|nr:aminoacyl-histidine dipeptidase [Erysipelothrix sp.]